MYCNVLKVKNCADMWLLNTTCDHNKLFSNKIGLLMILNIIAIERHLLHHFCVEFIYSYIRSHLLFAVVLCV